MCKSIELSCSRRVVPDEVQVVAKTESQTHRDESIRKEQANRGQAGSFLYSRITAQHRQVSASFLLPGGAPARWVADCTRCNGVWDVQHRSPAECTPSPPPATGEASLLWASQRAESMRGHQGWPSRCAVAIRVLTARCPISRINASSW